LRAITAVTRSTWARATSSSTGRGRRRRPCGPSARFEPRDRCSEFGRAPAWDSKDLSSASSTSVEGDEQSPLFDDLAGRQLNLAHGAAISFRSIDERSRDVPIEVRSSPVLARVGRSRPDRSAGSGIAAAAASAPRHGCPLHAAKPSRRVDRARIKRTAQQHVPDAPRSIITDGPFPAVTRPPSIGPEATRVLSFSRRLCLELRPAADLSSRDLGKRHSSGRGRFLGALMMRAAGRASELGCATGSVRRAAGSRWCRARVRDWSFRRPRPGASVRPAQSGPLTRGGDATLSGRTPNSRRRSCD
jgi:hypothetical protein